MARVRTRCGGISFSERGTGFPLVLPHASLSGRHDCGPVIPDLAGRYRVIAAGWPRHGESGCPPSPLKAGAGLFGCVLEDLAQALAPPPAAFIGSSAGGFAAARLAITHPEPVAGLAPGQQRRLHPGEPAHPRLLHADEHPCAGARPAAPLYAAGDEPCHR